MSLQVLVSTYRSKLHQNEALISSLKKSDHVIIDQLPERLLPGLNVVTMDRPGLSYSRNKAIEHMDGEFALIADDDIQLIDGFEETIKKAFRDSPESDVITFQIITPSGKPYKTYKSTPFRHNLKTILRVSSVEMAFRISSIKKAGISFHTNFGINAQYPCCEEPIFLRDCIRKGLVVTHSPHYISVHDAHSSGQSYKDPKYIVARGALFSEIYGLLGALICILFALKNRKKMGGMLNAVKYLTQGYFSYRPLPYRDSFVHRSE